MYKDILKIKGNRCYVTLHVTPDALRDKPIRYWADAINGRGIKTGVSKVFSSLSKIVGYRLSNTSFKIEHYLSLHPSIIVFDNEVEFVLYGNKSKFKIRRSIGKFERFTHEEIIEIERFMAKDWQSTQRSRGD